jgi:hypothetical protein
MTEGVQQGMQEGTALKKGSTDVQVDQEHA